MSVNFDFDSHKNGRLIFDKYAYIFMKLNTDQFLKNLKFTLYSEKINYYILRNIDMKK